MEPEGLLSCSQEPTTGPILSQMNPVHILTTYFLNVPFNIIILSVPGYGYPHLKEKHSLRVFKNRVIKKLSGPKREEVKEDRRKLHNEELNHLYSKYY
jgi:hypothetical protein